MASLRTLPDSKNFIACFTDINGRRRQRSTGTHVRKDAQRIAEQYEAAARTLKTEAQIRKVIADLYEQVGGTPLASGSAESFLTDWLTSKAAETSDATVVSYRSTIKRFLTHLGSRAALDLNYLTPSVILSFRDGLAAHLSPVSVNKAIKILRVAFNSARRAGLMQTNPADQVENIHQRKRQSAGETTSGRRPFTMPELRRVLEACDQEWRGMTLFGLYTGQRLGDIARLTWSNLDLAREELRFVAGKTGRQVILPLGEPLLRHLASMDASGKDISAPLFSRAYRTVSAGGTVGSLSNQFYDVLTRAGLVEHRTHKAQGKGRGERRAASEISFHSLRHTATSLLKNAGVSDVVAREFIGHDSPAISKHYTHIDTSTLREAAAKLPDVLEFERDSKKGGDQP